MLRKLARDWYARLRAEGWTGDDVARLGYALLETDWLDEGGFANELHKKLLKARHFHQDPKASWRLFERWLPLYSNWAICDIHCTSIVGVFLEDHYWDRTDAAVVFKRVDRWTGNEKYIYHGNDGTSMPWNDTAQLDYLRPEVREAVIQTILHVARQFSIIRFDAAMTLTKRHYQRLWFPEPGSGGAIPTRAEQGLTKEEFNARMPNEVGGIRRAGEPFTTLEGLHEQLAPHFRLLGNPRDVEFVIRETARKFQHNVAQLTIWERRR